MIRRDDNQRAAKLVVAAAALLLFALVWWLSPRTVPDAINVALAIGGAALTVVLVPRRPQLAVGIVFFLSSLSALEVQLSVGAMRLEQPAIAAMLGALVWYRKQLDLPSLRPIWPVLAAGVVYLAVSALSSAFVAPDPGQSLRLVAWSTVSMVGAVGVYLLVARAQTRLFELVALIGAFMAVAGLGAAVWFYFVGPGSPGIMGPLSSNPKVEAFALEANLYASLICATAFFAIERFRQDRSLLWAAVTVITLAGIGVGITRGAYIGLFAGFAVYGLVVWRRVGVGRVVASVAAVALVATAVGMITGAVLMDANARDTNLVTRGDAPPGRAEVHDDLATLDYRLVRIGPALEDLKSSPLIGLGMLSFGQRHLTDLGFQDYLNIMAVATLYDSGIIGTVALVALLAIVFVRLWRTSRDPARAGPAAAYLGALVTLLIAYQATNAIHFALNWVIIGAGLGLTMIQSRPIALSRPPEVQPALHEA